MQIIRPAIILCTHTVRTQSVYPQSLHARIFVDKRALLRRRCFATNNKSSRTAATSSGASHQEAPRITKAMIAHEGKEIVKMMFGGVLMCAGLLATSGYVIESLKQLNPMKAPGQFVELRNEDGKTVKVHYSLQGSEHKDVVVVLDGGVGETSFDWDNVAPYIAQFATVLSIDRPGLGFSTAGHCPRTAQQIAFEYEQLLSALPLPKQVVLVAHGAGGYNMRQLAIDLEAQGSNAQYRCRGMVLVDALQENLRQELEAVSEPVQQALEKFDSNGETVLRLSKFGIIRLITVIQHDKNATKYSAIALPYVEYFAPTPAHRQAVNEENRALPLTEQSFRENERTQGFSFPTVVMSHGKPDLFEGMAVQPGVDAHAILALERAWQHAQRTLVQIVSTRDTPAVQVVVKDAGHAIHHEQPNEIVRVVRAIVEEAREAGTKQGLQSLTNATCPI